MNLFDNLALGFQVALLPVNLFYCFVGVTVGTLVGVLPGIGPLVTIAVLLPLTFGLAPESALIMLAGIYYGAMYGGSTTSILLNLPGEPANVVTCMDGYQMARQGKAGPALAISAIGSFVAGCIATVFIALFAPPLTDFALEFRAPEYFSLMVAALASTAMMVQGSTLKGVLMVLVGLLFGLVGLDVNSGVPRYTFGLPGLSDGINFVVVAMGLYGIAELIRNLEPDALDHRPMAVVGKLMPSKDELRTSVAPILRGTAVGSFLGILPGAGTSIGAFAAYMMEKRVSRTPWRFGNGAIEGVASPEAANNAAAQTSFIPTLTLGVPAGPIMALMLGALIIQGLTPGPGIVTDHPRLFWGLVVSMWVGNLMLMLLNLPLIGLWVKLLEVPYRWLYPAIVVFACIGTYSLSNSTLDLYLTVMFGLFGYVCLKLDCEIAPFIMGFILAAPLEENLRRAMLISRGDPMVFVTRPISLVFLTLAALLLLSMILPGRRAWRERAADPQ